MGLYPVAGQSHYIIGSPLFPKMVIGQPQGDLTILAPGASHERRYVRGVFLDGVAVEGDTLEHADLAGASELRFELAE